MPSGGFSYTTLGGCVVNGKFMADRDIQPVPVYLTLAEQEKLKRFLHNLHVGDDK